MKFEQVLQIYWSKGFLFGGRIVPFQSNWRTFCGEVGGLGLTTRSKFLKRFELHQLHNNHLATYEHIERDIKKCINIILSQITSVNHQISEIQYFNLIRLYLIKSYRGKAQAMGKPSRGQRTWSNAWTAYNYNKIIRNFIVIIQRNINKDKKVEKINYKVLKKKLKKSTKPKIVKQPKKKNVWF